MIDVERIRRVVDLPELVRADGVQLKPVGTEYEALCPFHEERTASFRVVPDKGFMHCFGCGAHYDAVGYVMATRHVDFVEACRQLVGDDISRGMLKQVKQHQSVRRPKPGGIWVPVFPVPDDAPSWQVDVAGDVYNPKRGHWWRGLVPSRADAYRDAKGRLMGYVLRVDGRDGRKMTPMVTWCVGPDGAMGWTLQTFWAPRPLLGLDALAARPGAPVLVVEGEKCAAAAAQALPQYVVVTWPGGSKGVSVADWSPLAGREVVLWPDADTAGDEAMFGVVDRAMHVRRPGVVHQLQKVGAKTIRWVDVSGQPRGWDVADALWRDGWTPQQLAAWARTRVGGVTFLAEGRA